MKEQIAVSLAGLMLLTSGVEWANGKKILGSSSSKGAGRIEASHPKTAKPSEVSEKNGDRANLKKGGFVARADYLYWRADEEGVEYGSVTKIAPIPSDNSSHLKSPKVQWNSGFRLGMGYTFVDQDYWNLAALWTHFFTHQSDSKAFSGNGEAGSFFVPAWGTALLGTAADRAWVKWNLNYNVYDLNLARNYFVLNTLCVQPFVGLRGATIQQRYHASYNAIPNPGTSARIPTSFKAHTDFWGVGAHLGTALKWQMNRSFSFLGNVGTSLLYGDFKIREKYQSILRTNGVTTLFPFQEHLTTGAFNVDAMLGLQWEKFFNQNKYRLSFTAGYEWSEWFSQNRMLKLNQLVTSTNTIGNEVSLSKGDLTLQGASFQIRWEF